MNEEFKSILTMSNRAQLENMTKGFNNQLANATQALVTISFDDGWMEDYTIMFPYLQGLGVKGSSALISNFVDNPVLPSYMGMSQINTMKAYGWEFMSHTNSHLDLSTRTYEQAEIDLRTSKENLIAKGLDIKGITYPYNGYNQDTLYLTRKYYDFAFANGASTYINTEPINQYAIYRIVIEYDLSTNKARIDEAIAKNGWIVLCGHGMYYNATKFPDTSVWPGKWDENIRRAKDHIDYCIAQGARVVTGSEAIEIMGNSINLGDKSLSDNYFMVSKRGVVDSTSVNEQLGGKTIVDITYNAPWINGTPTVDVTTNIITLAGHGLSNNSAIEFNADVGVLPAGILAYNSDTLGGTYYNVINVSGDTFAITGTTGSTTPLDILSAGTQGWQIRKAVFGNQDLVVEGLNLDADKSYDIYLMPNYARSNTGAISTSFRLNGYTGPVIVPASALTGSGANKLLLSDIATDQKYCYGCIKVSLQLAGSKSLIELTSTRVCNTDKVTQTLIKDYATAIERDNHVNVTAIYFATTATPAMWRNGTRIIIIKK